MSLIQEALEKIGRAPEAASAAAPLRSPAVKVKTIPAPEKAAVNVKISFHPSRPVILGTALILFLGAFLVLYGLLKPNFSSSPVPAKGPEQESSSVFPVLPNLGGSLARPDFALTGITSSGGKNLALINNQVVGAGDRLTEGALVEEVAARKAVLLYHGRRMTLEL